MSQDKRNNSARKNLSALRVRAGRLAAPLRRVCEESLSEAVFVRVTPRGERRRDFLRRYRFRGVDVLRHQQRQADSLPPTRGSLDTLI